MLEEEQHEDVKEGEEEVYTQMDESIHLCIYSAQECKPESRVEVSLSLQRNTCQTEDDRQKGFTV